MNLNDPMYMYLLAGISKVFPDSSGTRMVLVDEKSDAFIYNPVRGTLLTKTPNAVPYIICLAAN